jgi:hypothetical protein
MATLREASAGKQTNQGVAATTSFLDEALAGAQNRGKQRERICSRTCFHFAAAWR